jgi:hypothetical protein
VYKVFEKYRARASNEAILALGELVTNDIDGIRSRDASICYDYIFSSKGGIKPIDSLNYFSPDVLEHRFEIIADAIETGVANPTRIPSNKEVSQLQKLVTDRLVWRYPALADPQSPLFSPANVCEAFAALFKEISTLPVVDRVPLLRFLFANRFTPRSG